MGSSLSVKLAAILWIYIGVVLELKEEAKLTETKRIIVKYFKT